MNFTTRARNRRRDVDISLTPLIDLFLNILTFFLITTTFATDSVFFVDLPEAKPGTALSERKSIAISIDENGKVSMDRELLTLDQLRTKLETIPKEKRMNMPVAIRADRNAKHGSVVTVIDSIRDLGLTNLGIVTQNPKQP